MDEFRRRPVNRAVPRQIPHRPPVSPPIADSPVPRRPVAPTLGPSQPMSQAPLQAASSPQPPTPTPPHTPQSISNHSHTGKKSKKRLFLWGGIGFVTALAALIVGVFIWYGISLSPVNSGDTTRRVVKVEAGTLPADIATLLQKEGIIRSSSAFLWYTRLQKVQNNLQAGTYRLSPAESTREIVDHLVKGKVDVINVTLFPGATLVDNTNTPDSKKYDVTTALKKAGYTQDQITAGLTADYPEYATTLFQGRPVGADLEGYVYGETYQVAADATVQDVLRQSFDQIWKYVQENDLVAKYKAHGLTLYQGLTLASIIQREASTSGDDMPQIAQVFYSRLALGMPLGSDITYQYIADKTGVPRDPNLDSPYNTRKYAGLPPGPVSAPGAKALLAVANPAQGDYLYFLSGDDNVTYFAHTLEEHQQNIANHCKEKCQIL